MQSNVLQRRAEIHERILAAIIREPNPNGALEMILGELEREFGLRRFLVFHHDRDKNLVCVLESRGFEKELAKQVSFSQTATNEAVTPFVAQTGEPYFALNAQSDDKVNLLWKEKLGFQGPLLALPLKVGDLVCGVLVINDERLTPEHVGVLLPFVNDLAIAVTVTEKNDQILARQRTTDLMKRVQSQFHQAHTEERTFLDSVAQSVAQIMNARLCAIYRRVGKRPCLALEEETVFERRGAFGYPESIREDQRITGPGTTRGLTNQALAGVTVNVPNVEDEPKWSGKEAQPLREVLNAPIRAFLGVPMTGFKGDVIGCITLTRPRVSKEDGLLFRSQDVELVTAICSAVAALLDAVDTMKEIKRHHAELDALFTALSQRVPEEVSVVNTDYTITYVNPAKKEKFKDDEPLVGKKCYQVFEKRDRVCPNCPTRAAMDRARRGDPTPVRDDRHYGRPTGGKIYRAKVVACAIRDSAGAVAGAVEVVRDLTAEVKPVDIQIMHGTHKILTDLASMRVWIDNVEMETENQKAMATGILNGHLHMLRTLVDQAHASVSTALNTSGPAVALLKPQDVAELIREVLRNATKDFGVVFEVKPDPPDRPWIINCDADRLREVFRELTVNARKATAGSGMATHITVTLQPWMHEGAELGVHIAFADNGPGFLSEYREHAFERFYRKFKEGYGLGLFLCNRLIEAHQGIIQVRDQTPGATFDIYLPTNSET